MSVVILIPAYNPDDKLLRLLSALKTKTDREVIVVNDGSMNTADRIFDKIKLMKGVALLEHDQNLGKGSALKTGLKFIQDKYPDASGVVAADCDGQHDVDDILKIADHVENNPDTPVIGTRTFGDNCSSLIKAWNRITRYIMKFSYGLDIPDVQCGLRGIPIRSIERLLAIPYNRYEFETEMLLVWKRDGYSINDTPIKTIGMTRSEPTNFNPLVDSMRIYFVLTRYAFVSIVTALTDYVVFLSVFPMLRSVLAATYFARLLALTVNYVLVRQFVFCSREMILKTFSKYFALVIISGFVSSALIEYLVSVFGIQVLLAKMISELILYIGIFAIQRDFVFVVKDIERVTDWDAYYEAPYRTASYSRAITTRHLIDNMNRFACRNSGLEIAELGGANSCFYDSVRAALSPQTYCICDNNALGLEKIKERAKDNVELMVRECDVLKIALEHKFDVVFSVGLVEHFDREGTAKAIKAHFDILKPGGIAIISFPSPTVLYKVTRGLAEFFRMWIFHDERPLEDSEVYDTIKKCGSIEASRVIWPIMLTQRMVVARKPE